MVATRMYLHTLVDLIDESELETLFRVMLKFVPTTAPLDDEVFAHNVAVQEYATGQTVGYDEINWD